MDAVAEGDKQKQCAGCRYLFYATCLESWNQDLVMCENKTN